jgi:3',5'-cyclic AMP phosphodiesterase CpdA
VALKTNASVAAGLALSFAVVVLGASDAYAGGVSPFSKGPYVQSLAATSAEVRVEVDPPAPVTIDFGDGGGPARIADKNATGFHVFPLTALSPATQYRYTVESGGATKAGTFTTAVKDDTTEPIKFLAYGDNRTDESAHAAVVRAMMARTSDFIVHTGDFVEHGGMPGLWQRWFDIEAPLVSSRCVFATIGNHELADKEAIYFLRYFGATTPTGDPLAAPILHRTFRWGYLRFFVLGGFGDLATEKKWLDDELDKSDHEPGIAFRIAVTHHGPWSSGPHGRNRNLHDAGIVSSLRKHRVDLILSGHDHIYERGDADGLPYVVTGGAGAPPYEEKERIKYSRAFDSARNFVEVTASPAALQLKAFRIDGTTIEQCGLRDHAWDCDAPSTSPSATSTSGTPTAPTPNGGGDTTKSSSCGCTLVGAADAKLPGKQAPQAGAQTKDGAIAAGAAALIALFLRARRRYARARCDLDSSSR